MLKSGQFFHLLLSVLRLAKLRRKLRSVRRSFHTTSEQRSTVSADKEKIINGAKFLETASYYKAAGGARVDSRVSTSRVVSKSRLIGASGGVEIFKSWDRPAHDSLQNCRMSSSVQAP